MKPRQWLLLLSSVLLVSVLILGLVSRLPPVSAEPVRLTLSRPPASRGACVPPDHAFPGTWNVPTPDPQGVLDGLALVLDRSDRTWILRCFDTEDAFIDYTRNGMGRWLASTLDLSASTPLTAAFERVGLRGAGEFSSAILRMEYRAVHGQRPRPEDVVPAVRQERAIREDEAAQRTPPQ